MTTNPSPNDPLDKVPSDRLWLRSELMGTHVITRDTGRRLGVVGEVVVDIDRREVVALGLRDNPLTRYLPGLPRWMPLDRIRQVGDVILSVQGNTLERPEQLSMLFDQVAELETLEIHRLRGKQAERKTYTIADVGQDSAASPPT